LEQGQGLISLRQDVVRQGQELSALRQDVIVQGQELTSLRQEMRAGFSTLVTSMAEVTTLLTKITEAEHGG
jgi:hypothetical protein